MASADDILSRYPTQDLDAVSEALPPVPPQRPFPENLAHMPRGAMFDAAHQWLTRNVLEPIQYMGMYPARVASRMYPDWPVPNEDQPARVGLRRRMGDGDKHGGPLPINEIDAMGTYAPGERQSDMVEDRRPRSPWEYADGGEVDNILGQYGQGYTAPQLNSGDGETLDTQGILERYTRRQEGVPGILRGWADSVRGASRPDNVLAGGLDTAANWIGGEPEIGKDTIAPLGLGVMGSLFAPHNALGAFGGKLTPDAFWRRSDWLDSTLPYNAERAIEDWVGGPPMARVIIPDHAGAFNTRRLEDAYSTNPTPEGLVIRQELEQQAARMREQLRETYGDTVPAYRGQRPVPEGAAERTLLSYTTDPRMAERAVNAPRRAREVLSDEQIAAFERELQARGEVTVRGTTYRLEDSLTPGEKYVMMYDRAGDEITDAFPDMPSVLRRNNADAEAFNAERQALLDQVQRVNIPVDDVVWATNRFGQHELIARPSHAGQTKGADAEQILRQYGNGPQMSAPSLNERWIADYRAEGTLRPEHIVTESTMPMSNFNGRDIRSSQTTVDPRGVRFWEKQIKEGARPAILLEQTPDGFRIVDGHTRATAYSRAGIEDVPVLIRERARD